MPSEALSVLFLDVHSASNGIDGGTGCNFILFFAYMLQCIRNFLCVHEHTCVFTNTQCLLCVHEHTVSNLVYWKLRQVCMFVYLMGN